MDKFDHIKVWNYILIIIEEKFQLYNVYICKTILYWLKVVKIAEDHKDEPYRLNHLIEIKRFEDILYFIHEFNKYIMV